VPVQAARARVAKATHRMNERTTVIFTAVPLTRAFSNYGGLGRTRAASYWCSAVRVERWRGGKNRRLKTFASGFRTDVYRNKAVQQRVLSLVDDTHPAATQFLDNAVMRNSLADHGATPC
jgi:hypothetical protein